MAIDSGLLFYTQSSVVGLSVCLCAYVSVTFVSPAKTAEPIEMLFGVHTCVDQRNHVLKEDREME